VYPVPQIATAPGVALDELAMAQAGDVKFGYSSTHTMPVIESKDEARRRGARSPDRAEAIMPAYARLPEPETMTPGIVAYGSVKVRLEGRRSKRFGLLGEIYRGPLLSS